MNESVQYKQKRSQLSQAGHIISAHQLQKLAKNNTAVFLAIVRTTNEAPQKRGRGGNKRSPNLVVINAAVHSITEGEKRRINKKNWAKEEYYICCRMRTRGSR